MKRLLSLFLMVLVMTGAVMAEAMPVCPEVILAGNPTTGYSWTWTTDADEAIVAVEGGYVPAEAAEGMVGVGGQYCFVLQGVAAGETVITFAYARPWENQAPLYTIVYHVRVDENLNVTILSSSFDW